MVNRLLFIAIGQPFIIKSQLKLFSGKSIISCVEPIITYIKPTVIYFKLITTCSKLTTIYTKLIDIYNELINSLLLSAHIFASNLLPYPSFKFLKGGVGAKLHKALGRFVRHSAQYCVTLARRTASTTSFGCLVLHPIGKQIAASHLTAQVFKQLRPGRKTFFAKKFSSPQILSLNNI